MPYGVDKDIGGDNPSNVGWMEKCVSGVTGTNKRTGKPYTKGEKIAICKSQLKKKRSKSDVSDFTEVDADVISRVEDIIYEFSEKLYQQKIASTLTDGYQLAQAYLARCGHDVDLLRLVRIK